MSGPHFPPGPWKIEQAQKEPHHLMVLGPRGHSIGMVFVSFPEPTGEQRATANLVREAPAIYDVLVMALDEYEQHNGRRVEGPHWSVEAREVLDRAESNW